MIVSDAAGDDGSNRLIESGASGDGESNASKISGNVGDGRFDKSVVSGSKKDHILNIVIWIEKKLMVKSYQLGDQ